MRELRFNSAIWFFYRLLLPPSYRSIRESFGALIVTAAYVFASNRSSAMFRYMDNVWFFEARLSYLCRLPLAAEPNICVTSKRQRCNRASLFCHIHDIFSQSTGAMFHKCNIILFSALNWQHPECLWFNDAKRFHTNGSGCLQRQWGICTLCF